MSGVCIETALRLIGGLEAEEWVWCPQIKQRAQQSRKIWIRGRKSVIKSKSCDSRSRSRTVGFENGLYIAITFAFEGSCLVRT